MPIITISRGSKSGGRALAECLADHLHYPVLGREVVQEAAAKLGVSEEAVGQGMQDAPKLWGGRTSTRKMYVTAVQAALAERIADGDLIYHGLAGQMLLRGVPTVLRVRLIAPLEARIRTLMDADGLDRPSAEKYIRDVDDARGRWVKMMYGQDIADPMLYDVVLNLEVMSLRTACALVTKAAQQPAFAASDETRGRLGDFRLACQARVALLGDAQTRGLNLEVQAAGGVIEVSGGLPVLPSGHMEEDVSRVLGAVRAARAIRLHIQWFSH